jgi:membrane protease YdiL (CAAX protease family)
MSSDEARARGERNLAWWQFLLIVVVYLAIIQILGRVFNPGVDSDDAFATTSSLFKGTLLPIALSSVFAVGVATWLGWWKQIIHEPKPVQNWVRIVPIVLVLAAAAGTSWGNLFDQKAELVLTMVVAVAFVGFTEELMFRGIGVEYFRRMGLTEARVALYTSVVFGAVHLSNALATGSKAILQAVVVSFTGYMLYLTRRWAGVIWVAMAVHSSQDFALLSGQIGVDANASPATVLVVLAMIVLAIVLWRRRHRIEPSPGEASKDRLSTAGAT